MRRKFSLATGRENNKPEPHSAKAPRDGFQSIACRLGVETRWKGSASVFDCATCQELRWRSSTEDHSKLERFSGWAGNWLKLTINQQNRIVICFLLPKSWISDLHDASYEKEHDSNNLIRVTVPKKGVSTGFSQSSSALFSTRSLSTPYPLEINCRLYSTSNT